MKIPIRVYENITREQYLDGEPANGYQYVLQEGSGFGDFFLNATYYKVSYHSGCRHTKVRGTLHGVVDIFIQGVFQKREVSGVPGESCTGCGKAWYV
jgi:hypothetical protein